MEINGSRHWPLRPGVLYLPNESPYPKAWRVMVYVGNMGGGQSSTWCQGPRSKHTTVSACIVSVLCIYIYMCLSFCLKTKNGVYHSNEKLVKHKKN